MSGASWHWSPATEFFLANKSSFRIALTHGQGIDTQPNLYGMPRMINHPKRLLATAPA